MFRLSIYTLCVLAISGMAPVAMAADSLDPAGKPEAAAAQQAPKVPSGDQWSVRCDKTKEGGKYCEVFQNLSIKNKDSDKLRRVAEFAIGYSIDKKKKAQAVLILPLGVLLTEEIKVSIDDKNEFPAEMRYCDVAGCFAFTEISDGLLEKMRKGEKVTIKGKAATGQELNIVMGLKGFGKALDQVKG